MVAADVDDWLLDVFHSLMRVRGCGWTRLLLTFRVLSRSRLEANGPLPERFAARSNFRGVHLPPLSAAKFRLQLLKLLLQVHVQLHLDLGRCGCGQDGNLLFPDLVTWRCRRRRCNCCNHSRTASLEGVLWSHLNLCCFCNPRNLFFVLFFRQQRTRVETWVQEMKRMKWMW